ncbi:hypothetical protein RF11_04063 [Thelohanellus kitauei]|uniref:Uncharacterized protein n=1 Tax=Thelohanellus kitauei TaxID=669202 RepID=A0A0C2MYQ9_THEKT|nr:hypothetical protein RF11_04063 [Thelohanellus kitauei]
MKYLNDNAQDMEAKDIDTSIHQVSQCKKTLETSVTAYKDAVKTKKLGNIDSLIVLILKHRQGYDQIFRVVSLHTLNLLKDIETMQGKITTFKYILNIFTNQIIQS